MHYEHIVIDLPIEPIETRYSKQWTEWFPLAYGRNNMFYTQIKGDPGTTLLDTTHFLDPIQTWNWKFTQLKNTVSFIRGSVAAGTKRFTVFLHDAWFPGIECLKYISDMTPEVTIKIVGFWHAGAYIPQDPIGQAGMEWWVKDSEKTWFKICDAICLGSEYHKQVILTALGDYYDDRDKVHVTGYPIEVPKCDPRKKKNIVVWPHRLSPEKRSDIFDQLSKDLAYTGWKFIKTMEVCKTKQEYYNMLGMAKIAISTAELETFGIAMVEAAMMGCTPIAPKRLAYPETLKQIGVFAYLYDYNNYNEILSMAQEVIDSDRPYEYPFSLSISFQQERVTNEICHIIAETANA